MSIINSNFFQGIISWGKKHDHHPIIIKDIKEQSNHCIYFKMYDWSDTDYWFVQFLHADAFYWYPIKVLAGNYIYEKIKKGEVTLLLCHKHEAYHSVIDEIYQFLVIEQEIPPKNILLLSNSYDIATEIDYVAEKYSLEKIKASFIFEFAWDARKIAYDAHHDKQNFKDTLAFKTLENKSYEKKYLCLNGFNRPHRVSLVNLLNIHDLLKDGIVSYNTNLNGSKDPGGEFYYHELLKWHTPESQLSQDIKANKDKVIALEPIWLDTTVDTSRNMAAFHDTKTHFYTETYFSVVTETLCMRYHSQDGFTGAGREVSEKTFKAILNRHPFILVAIPGTLKLLKDMGFKTFHPLIREEYDDIWDDSERLYQIMLEVKRLCSLDNTQLTSFLTYCRAVCEYNFQRLLNMKDFCLPLNHKGVIFSNNLRTYDNSYLPVQSFNVWKPGVYTNVAVIIFCDQISTIPRGLLSTLESCKTYKLIIVHQHSPLHISTMAKNITKELRPLLIEQERIYFIIMDKTQTEDFRSAMAEEGYPRVRIEAHHHLMIDLNPIYEIEEQPIKRFNCFTRSYRHFRLEFFIKLIENDLLEDFYYTFTNIEPHKPVDEQVTDLEKIKQLPCVQESEKRDEILTWIDNIPYTIGSDIESVYSEDLFRYTKKSWLSIVCESLIDDGLVYITEKTGKAIAGKRPFIIYGASGSYDHLKKLGFRTFSPVLNEDFDLEPDHKLRLNLIIDEIKRLQQLPIDEFTALMHQCNEVVEYNFQVLKEMKQHKWSKPFEDLGVFS